MKLHLSLLPWYGLLGLTISLLIARFCHYESLSFGFGALAGIMVFISLSVLVVWPEEDFDATLSLPPVISKPPVVWDWIMENPSKDEGREPLWHWYSEEYGVAAACGKGPILDLALKHTGSPASLLQGVCPICEVAWEARQRIWYGGA